MLSIAIKNKYKKGFGIIEVLIASVVIVLIIGAVTSAGMSSLRSSTRLQRRGQAAYLAQEGLEAVRQIRDTNWVDGNNLTNWATLENLSGDKKLSFASGRWGLVDMATADDLEKITIDGMEFKRKLTFEPTNDNLMPNITTEERSKNSFKFTVNVTWPGGPSGGIIVSEILTNWRPNY